MSEDVGAAITLFTGLMAIRLVVADGYLTYVRRSMGPWLLLAGLALVILAGVRLVRSIGSANDHGPHRPHAHGHAPRVALLLLAPLLAVVLIDPPPLGSFTARRAGPAQRPQEVSSNSGLDPLPAPRGGAVDLSLDAFSQRALYHQGLGLRRTPSGWSASPAPIPGGPARSCSPDSSSPAAPPTRHRFRSRSKGPTPCPRPTSGSR